METPRARLYALPGRYANNMHERENESFPLRLPNTAQLVGAGDAGTIVVDGRRGGIQFQMNGGLSEANLIENILIDNAGGQFGSAITLVDTTLELRDVQVRGCRTPNGWGVMNADDSTIETHGLVVTECNGTGGADGLFRINQTTLLLDACHIAGNQAGDADSGRGIVWNQASNVMLTNCTFVHNTGNGVYHASADATLEVIHSSFVDHSGSALNLLWTENVVVANSVFSENGRYGVWESANEGDIAVLAGNVFWGNEGGDYYDRDRARARNGADQINGLAGASGNVHGNPQFISLPANNLRLREGSACVDVGDPEYGLEVDQDDRARPRGARPDSGAFESFFEP
jgi:hypothetical protein